MHLSAHSKFVIFFDTNIALHYQRLDQINWRSVSGHEQNEIIVCAVVLNELDKHKTDNFSKKLRKRAADYSAWLLEKFSAPALNQHVSITFCPNEPQLNFAKHQLDQQILDDRLIAAVIEYTAAHPEQPVCVITADIGLTLKLKMRGITVFNLPGQYRLSEEADADEIEMRNLRSQLSRYTNRQPKLLLTFADGAQVFTIERSRQLVAKPEFIEVEMEKIKAEHPLLSHAPNTPTLPTSTLQSLHQLSAQIGQTFNSLSQSQRESYNRSLERFHSEYEVYLNKLYDHAVRSSALFDLPLMLSNLEGSAPATNIDIVLQSSDGAQFTKEKQPRPESPTMPRKPTSIFDMTFDTRPALVAPRIPNLHDLMRENASDRPTLSVSSGTARFSIPTLKHKQQTKLLPILLDFGALANVRNVTLSYEIHAHEMLEPVYQQLHLKLAA